MPEKQLVVIGNGPDFKKIQALAKPNIKLLGYQPFEVLKDYMQRARAFIFAAEEDFGIVPVEAQACNTPVIAYGKGGVLETVIEGKTGVFFERQTTESLISAIQRFELMPLFDPIILRKNAERFGRQRFQSEFQNFVKQAWQSHQKKIKSEEDETPL
jgi:glycosyltransferase involved in cell wall biosynthesis